MIDLHSHVLPGIDDGAPSLDVSIAMLDAWAGMGFRTVAATPHLTGILQPDYATRVDEAFAAVEPRAGERGIALVRGYEVQLDPGTAAQMAAGAPITLAGSGLVLVDLPFTEWPMYADAALFAVQAAGYRVILAHPERYPGIQENPDKAGELVERGIALQVTTGSLGGAFGKAARRSAEDLLGRGLVHLVATDAHSAGHRMAAVPAGLARLRELVGDEGLRRLTAATPAAILAGHPLPAPVQAAPRPWHRRLAFWR